MGTDCINKQMSICSAGVVVRVWVFVYLCSHNGYQYSCHHYPYHDDYHNDNHYHYYIITMTMIIILTIITIISITALA